MRSRGPYYSLARPVFEAIEGHGEGLTVNTSSDSFNAVACVSIRRPEKCQCGMQVFRVRAAPRINVLFAQGPQAVACTLVWP